MARVKIQDQIDQIKAVVDKHSEDIAKIQRDQLPENPLLAVDILDGDREISFDLAD